MNLTRRTASLLILVFLDCSFGLASRRVPKVAAVSSAVRRRIVECYGRLPMSFTSNEGQADPRSAFTAQGSGYSIALDRTGPEATLSGRTVRRATAGMGPGTPAGGQQTGMDVLYLSFPGASLNTTVSGVDRLPGDNSYLLGSDASRWHVSVPNYQRVKYAGVYPGVDLVYYGNHRLLEFDFVLAPHAHAGASRLDLRGVLEGKELKLALNTAGDLVAKEGGRVLLPKPSLYQLASSGKPERQTVKGGFVLAGSNQVSFQIGAYDHSRELVIDPTLAYSTFFGGDNASSISSVAVDAVGDAFVIGSTAADDFPVTPGALDPSETVNFLSELNPSGTALIYSTFIPASVGSSSIAIDKNGYAYIAGGDSIAKVNKTGTAFLYSTSLTKSKTKSGVTTIRTIAVDEQGDVYVGGDTTSSNFPTTPGVLQAQPPPDDPTNGSVVDTAFLTKLNAKGSALVYSTYLGGDGSDANQIALDSADNVYVLGTSSNPDFLRVSRGAFSKVGSKYLAKVNRTASKLTYYTHLGPYNADALAVNAAGNAYLTGSAAVNGPPSYPSEAPCSDCSNLFAIKLNTTASALEYSAFLGKSYLDPNYPDNATESYGYGIAVDATDNAYITGGTDDPEFPVTANAYQKILSVEGGNQALSIFVTELDPSGKILYSTFFGGGQDNEPSNIVLDKRGDAFIAGFAEGDLPTTPGAFQTTTVHFNGFISKFSFTEDFCSLNADFSIAIDPSKQQGFALIANLTLGSAAPLDPTEEPFTLTIGSEVVAIPPGKLVKTAAGYSFDGVVDGIQLFLLLHEVPKATNGSCQTPSYVLLASGTGGSYETSANPIDLTIGIGENSGSLKVKPKIIE